MHYYLCQLSSAWSSGRSAELGEMGVGRSRAGLRVMGMGKEGKNKIFTVGEGGF